MKRWPACLIGALLLVGFSALADEAAPPLVGEVIGGVKIYRDALGKLTFGLSDTLALSNGRQLVRKDGKVWEFADEADAAHPKQLSGLDFSAYGRDYLGQVVIITGGSLFNADANRAVLKVPGSYVDLSYGSLPRTVVRDLIRDCAGISDASECRYTVTGTVERSYSGLGLRDIALSRPSPHR